MSAAGAVTLRAGRGGRALFVIPGAGGSALELKDFAAALPGRRPVIGLEPFTPQAGGDQPMTVEAMALVAAAAIRERQPAGPYQLIGYSFGGLVALETALALREAGEAVSFVGLVDTVFDRRFWPLGLFLAATARRTVGHLARLARRPLGEALPELATRAGRLAGRVAARGGGGPVMVAARAVQARCLIAMAAYAPRACAVPVTLFQSTRDGDFGCDPADLWRPWIAELEVRPIDGAHLDLVRDAAALAALAQAVDAALAAADAPPTRVLLAAGFNWIATARLALGLTEAGFAVQAVCHRRHSLRRLGFLERLNALDPLRLETSLERAIGAGRPDLILACDDPMTQALHRLHDRADPATADGAWLRARLARSLGPPETYAWLYSRAAITVIANEEGVRHPATGRVRSLDDVANWMADRPGPAMLKSDGSWGGREVVFVRDPAEAARAFRRMNAPPGALRSLKRWLVEGDATSLKALLARRRPALSLQAFVPGVCGNAAVACLEGRVLAAVYVEVVRSNGALGPATVVRVMDNPDMARTVEAMVRRLGLTGLCGFDFILEAGTGAAHMIELNPRATPTAHLTGADGGDLPAALLAALRQRAAAPRRRPIYAGGLVALFPQELRRDPVSVYLRSAHHDVPWHAPDLVDIALAEAGTPRALLDRLARGLAPRTGSLPPP
ncbi:thioesterase domain-containing protein [Phenylobacterium sp.]|uniref:thioesterase domain-containing protein n=1 Tax=Phenylobacterium sp. TaxID=1871053 RepID=UPI0025F597FC|nr:thioesterase domain-containing protein [Phenylobacterium sp.]